jgi:adenine-specific DNA-methyltransferase
MSDFQSQLQIAIKDFATRDLREAALALLSTLGYESSRVIQIDSLEDLPNTTPLENEKPEIKSLQGLFQLTTDEVRSSGQSKLFQAGQFENSIIESYVFIALELTKPEYNRAKLAEITRGLNKAFTIPVFIIFKHGTSISLSVTRRRTNKRDQNKDVLEKVTIIKDIALTNPHRAHLDILEDLHLPSLLAGKVITEFVELERMWAKVLDISALNDRFYKELSGWFYWALDYKNVQFPNEKNKDSSTDERQKNLIRFITRLIFTWFLKEKNLVPEKLFEPKQLANILKKFVPLEENDSTYYQSILQNLFFATLNTEMGLDDHGQPHRHFKSDTPSRSNTGYMVHNLYRYQSSFVDSSQAVQDFGTVPFLNGGLFECLDREKNLETNEKEIRIDGFSDDPKKRASIPNILFFSESQTADLSAFLGTKYKNAKVRGILEILKGYKFTVTENTPIEEEVALDPELLGKVFENLLAAYNPETLETARKQTGSFYTPRDVVDFMVDESLIAYLHQALTGGQPIVTGVNTGEQPPMLMPENDPSLLLTPNIQAGDTDPLEQKLRRLFSYSTDYKPEFSSADIQKLVTAIDNAKILDPACGSGAFPMGVLQKLVFVLGRLDPQNKRWKEQQRERSIGEKILELKADMKTAQQLNDQEIRNQAIAGLENRLLEIERAFDKDSTDLDYARKLFLIENCIYGVDIQPIAVQIAKLRCFISLVIDQKESAEKPNRGILPLPNLETKFVAANSLMPLGDQMPLVPPEVIALENELEEIRHEHFRAKNFNKKKELRKQDAQTRRQIAGLLEQSGYAKESARRMAAFDPYNQNTSAPFFDPHWMFGHTGFDIIIGNPPYVRHEKIKDQKPELLKAYGKQFFSSTADLYVYFFKRGLDVLNSGGILSYICSNKYFRSGYGANLRQHLLEKTRVRQIIDFGDAPVFTAIAYPSILVVQNQKPVKSDTMRVLSWNQTDDINSFREIVETQSFAMPQNSLKPEV